jgi:hypothetical protein
MQPSSVRDVACAMAALALVDPEVDAKQVAQVTKELGTNTKGEVAWTSTRVMYAVAYLAARAPEEKRRLFFERVLPALMAPVHRGGGSDGSSSMVAACAAPTALNTVNAINTINMINTSITI